MTTTLARPLWIVIIASGFHLCAAPQEQDDSAQQWAAAGFGGAARAFFAKRK